MTQSNMTLLSRGKKFLSYYKPYRGWLAADLFCALILSAVTLIFPLCARYITQNLLGENPPDALQQIMLMAVFMLILLLIQLGCDMFVDYQGHMMGAKMERDMRHDLFKHYQKQSFGFYDERKTGKLMSRLTNDLFWLSELYHHGPEDLLIAILNFTGAIIILMTINVNLALIIFLFLPVMAIHAFYFNAKMNHALRLSKERIGDINAQVEDSLSGVRVMQSFANESIELEKFDRENHRFVESRRMDYLSSAYFSGGMNAFMQLIPLAVIVFGAVSILRGGLDLTDLVTFLLYVGSLTDPVKRAVNFARLYQEGITGFNRFMEMMAIQPDITDKEDAIELNDVSGQVTFEHVSFKYRDNHAHVLNDLSLDITAGEYVALVGTSGVGKTTLCSLIPRFYEIDDGQILVDSVNIQDVTMQSLRRNIGIVQQDVYLFGGTVAENIAYGNPLASREEIIEAAKKANAHDFILALPDGYDSYVGQRGVKLSGGQKQRLSIARVFLKNPSIIIFDEATSSLDNESEKAVRQSMEALSENRTTIVIAHRLSTVQNADRIVVLTENGIEEQGTHYELLASDGVYANLYNQHVDTIPENIV